MSTWRLVITFEAHQPCRITVEEFIERYLQGAEVYLLRYNEQQREKTYNLLTMPVWVGGVKTTLLYLSTHVWQVRGAWDGIDWEDDL